MDVKQQASDEASGQDIADDGVAHAGALAHGSLEIAGNIGMNLAAVAPTASVALTLAALLVASGYANPVAILVTSLPMFGVAFAYRRLIHWRPSAGAVYDWGARAVSPIFGFWVGWILFLAYLLGCVSILIPLGPYVMSLVGSPNSSVGEAVVGCVGAVAISVIAFIGIKLTARTQWILIVIEYICIAILAALVLIAVISGTHGTVAIQWHSVFSLSEMGGVSGLVAAALIAVYMFSGWEIGSTVAEETDDPRSKPGTAIMASLVASTLMFVILMFIFQFAAPKSALEEHANALQFIAQQVSGGVLAKYVIIAVALSALGSGLAAIVGTARVGFAMGSDGVFPRALGRTHSRSKVPIASTATVAIFTIVVALVFPLTSSSVQSSFSTIVSVDGLLFGLLYASVALTAAVYCRRAALASPWSFVKLELIPLVSAGLLVYMAVKSVPGLGGWGGEALVSLYVMMGIGAAILLYVRRSGKSEYFSLRHEVLERAAHVEEGGAKPVSPA